MNAPQVEPIKTVDDWLAQASAIKPQWRARRQLRLSLLGSPELQANIDAQADPQLARHIRQLFDHPYWSFEPRPNNFATGDEQELYFESQALTTVCLGGNGCLAGEEEVFDPVANQFRRLDSIRGGWHVFAKRPDTGEFVVAEAKEPWVKGIAPLYRWTLENGVSFVGTDEHRVVSASGTWITLRDAYDAKRAILHHSEWHECHADCKIDEPCLWNTQESWRTQNRSVSLFQSLGEPPRQSAFEVLDDLEYGRILQASTLEPCRYARGEGVRHSSRKAADWICHCFYGSRRNDAPLPSWLDIAPDSAPLQAGVRGRSQWSLRSGAPGSESRRIHLGPQFGLPSTVDDYSHCQHRLVAYECQVKYTGCKRFSRTVENLCEVLSTTVQQLIAQQFPEHLNRQFHTTASVVQREEDPVFSASHPPVLASGNDNSVRIVSREYVGTRPFYDIEVPRYNNYLHKGLTAANSGKSYIASQRLIRFCCEEQPPPMKDTPFFVIAVTLEEAQRTCWTQHLYKLLPEEWVDWNRIVYASRKLNWPRVVPLKPWANSPDKNWTLYFCGYSQDRAAFQSVAAGGAWFTEQCDYDIYEEVLFRMRRYMYPGSIWMEFTPIDPSKAVEIKQKYEDWAAGKIPPEQWQFARLNTEEAAKAGHVKQEIVDQAKSSMSSDVLATRLYGVFAGYEGSIYKDFSARVHLIPNDYYGEFQFNPDCIHKRGIDWGSGPANAFVVLWGQRDTLGRWVIYDEYYTTESNTWEDRFRDVHRKDGWDLVAHVDDEGHTFYTLEPLVPHPRWQYSAGNFQQTYAPTDQPGLFREAAKCLLPLARARMDRDMGIDAVTRALKFDQTSLDSGMAPHLFIDRIKCPHLAWELPALQWQEMPHYKTNPRIVKREQKHINDHAPDAARYLLLNDWLETSAAGTTGFWREQKERPQVRHNRERFRR